MTWVIERNGDEYYALKEGAGHLFKVPNSEIVRVATHPWQHKTGNSVLLYEPLEFKSQEEAQQAIIDYEAKPIADEIISNARKTPFTPSAIAIEARVKEMVREAVDG